MRQSSSARLPSLIGFVAALSLAFAVLAQVPVPPVNDPDNAGPVRERRLVQRLEQARQMLAPREPNEKPEESQALRLLQTLLEDSSETDDGPAADDVLLDPAPEGDRRVATRSLKFEARQLIGGMSPQGRQAYELLVGKAGRVQLGAALVNGDWRAVEEVARQSLHTSAGYDATVALGLRELDLGEPLAAARRFEEVRDWPHARAPREPLLSLRLALAWRLAGRDERCREVLLELKKSFGDKPVARNSGGELPWFTEDSEALDWQDRWAGVPLRPLRMTGERRAEWPLQAGNAARNSVAAPAVPTEHVAWSHSLLDDDDAESPPDATADTPDSVGNEKSDRSPTVLRGTWGRVRVEVKSHLEQRRQTDQTAVIAAQPIVVGDVVVIRTLSQLRAFRLSDGQSLWHSAMVDPQLAEMLGDVRRGRRPTRLSPELEGWLQQRVWEDVTHGSLSSDGELIFSLQDREGNLRSPQIAWRGMFISREFNKLVAIEAATGRLRWELGGPRGDYELSGSGAYFLGPPLPWRGQLFALTDDGIDLRLVVLDPRDGKLLWTQTLAPCDPIWSGMARDTGLSPTVVGECIVCPTGAGSIVAVDPVRRELRWQHAYREPMDRIPARRFDFHPPNSGFEASWRQSVSIAARDRVLVAPPDLGELLCLDACDGRLLWKQPRAEGLFLAGITEDSNVLVVTANEVRALRLSDGKPAWPRAVSITPLGGHGVLSDGVLHLPLISGEVVSIETRSGRLLARTAVAAKELLGNLIAADGRLVSQSASHIAAFPQLREHQQAIADALLQNADNARALEERGRMNLHLGRRERGLEDLRRAIALRPTAEAKQLLAGLLLDEVRLGQSTDLEATIRELETLLDDPKQRLLFARLRAASWQRRGESLAAARELLKLADAWEPSTELEIVTGSTAARLDRWLAAELLELHSAMSAEDRRVLDDEVAARLRTALEGSGPARLRDFLALFGWNNSASVARRTLIERLDARKQRHEFESQLLAEGGAFAAVRLAQQWLSLGQVELARPLIDDLATRFADEQCLEGKTGREWAARWREEFSEPLKTGWPTQALKSEKVSNSEPLNAWYHLDWSAPPDALHENWQLWRDAGGRAVVARDSFGREQWRTKLPFENYSTPHVVGLSATWHARWLVLNLGERFLVLDTLTPSTPKTENDGKADAKPEPTATSEPRLMWQSVLFDRRQEPQVTPLPARIQNVIAGTPDRFVMSDSSGRRLGRVAIVGHDVICHQAGHRLIASSLATGELLWIFDGLPAGCELSGDERFVVATSTDGRELFVLSTLDGRLLKRAEIGAATRLATLGRNVLTWSESELRLFDAATNTDLLRERFPLDTLPCVSLGDSVAMLEPTGRFTIWSLRDGQRLLEQKLPPIENVTHFVVLRDRERWLLLTNVEEPVAADKPRPRVSLLNFDHWRVHGPAFGFERTTGRQQWSASVDWDGLQAAQPADSPVLLLATRMQIVGGPQPQPQPPSPPTFRVSVLDKRNGRLLPLSADLRADQRNFTDLRPNLADKTIDVQIERELHRLSFEK
ncbi:MAG: hypothetical protein DWI21_11220 [Planctomycetota bacterium]|nr:MAG: hypothetical protein DWI21_11220 [Planctomycetota bacterium]